MEGGLREHQGQAGGGLAATCRGLARLEGASSGTSGGDLDFRLADCIPYVGNRNRFREGIPGIGRGGWRVWPYVHVVLSEFSR